MTLESSFSKSKTSKHTKLERRLISGSQVPSVFSKRYLLAHRFMVSISASETASFTSVCGFSSGGSTDGRFSLSRLSEVEETGFATLILPPITFRSTCTSLVPQLQCTVYRMFWFAPAASKVSRLLSPSSQRVPLPPSRWMISLNSILLSSFGMVTAPLVQCGKFLLVVMHGTASLGSQFPKASPAIYTACPGLVSLQST
mmetsp:Transcript_59016/g.140934  ORF Transcript_59016/g.140934 Transcript_59016/m.140934 type:complete len:200 (+) Transcript_59016:1544-2143(+)